MHVCPRRRVALSPTPAHRLERAQGVQLASDLLGVDLAAMFQRVANGDRTALTPPAPPAADDGAVANPV